MARRPRTLGVLGVLAAAVLPLSAGGPASQAAVHPPAVPSSCQAPVCYFDGFPEPGSGNPATTPHQRRLEQRAEQLVDHHDELLAGEYVEDDGDVALVWVGPRGHRLARRELGGRDGASLVSGPVSLRRGGHLGGVVVDRRPHFANGTILWGVDPYRGTVFFGTDREANDADRALLERFAARHHVSIDVWYDPSLGRGGTD